MSAQAGEFNGVYTGERLSRVAFPLGGMGAGMFCLEGVGALSHFSLRGRPELNNEPCVFSAICIRGEKNTARILEGSVPGWKISERAGRGSGAWGRTYGLPRFSSVSFKARFPFAAVKLNDGQIPLEVEITGWSPFIPLDADNSSLPVAALEYRFTNPTGRPVEAVYSFHAKNFLATGSGGESVGAAPGGFILRQPGTEEKPWEEGNFCVLVDESGVRVNRSWFRGGWFDSLSIVWRQIAEGNSPDRKSPSKGEPSPGGSIYLPFRLAPGAEKMIRVLFSWYAPATDVRFEGSSSPLAAVCCRVEPGAGEKPETYRPWYAEKFSGIEEVSEYWQRNYPELRRRSLEFSECLFDSTLPPEVMEAVAANLSILKSPTVLRQADGRLWGWEGCNEEAGCCPGTCTHVWNYAQALPHLFPELERGLRQTEFYECQADTGHQNFRVPLPIRPAGHEFHAAADGQLGGIMKVYRDWRISGDTEWLRAIWPRVRASLHYCIKTWDPDEKGVPVEPHHNTFDVEFWGPDGMCGSLYLGALKAAALMVKALGEEVPLYAALFEKGRKFMEEELYNGEYCHQKTEWRNPRASGLIESEKEKYSPEAVELFRKEGPKYQYGTGCLAAGIMGSWFAVVCGMRKFLDEEKVRNHLRSVYKYNFRKDLSDHANPERSTFAFGKEGGLIHCTWPRGGRPSLPYPGSDEIHTGFEYMVASHMISEGMVEEGLEIVRACRRRYDGRIRNPFSERECGYFYARALASYSLLQALSGIRYDAVEKNLYVRPRIKGDFRSFLSTATGYGTAGIKDDKPFIEVKQGRIDIEHIRYEQVNEYTHQKTED